MIDLKKKLRLTFVPAAAVIRRERALSGMIGRKVFVDGKKFMFKILVLYIIYIYDTFY